MIADWKAMLQACSSLLPSAFVRRLVSNLPSFFATARMSLALQVEADGLAGRVPALVTEQPPPLEQELEADACRGSAGRVPV